MAAVTITRQFGAGGAEVARRAAEQLGWTVVDREVVDAVAAQAGLPPEEVAAHEERVPSLITRLGRALAVSSPEMFVPSAASTAELEEERIVRVTERVLREAAAHGKVVLVGRGAIGILADRPKEELLHVWVTAPRAFRVRAVAQREGVNEEEAARLADRTDADRDRYVKRWYGLQRADAANYHLVVNTGLLGFDGAAEVVACAARGRGWG